VEKENREDEQGTGDYPSGTAWPRPRYGLSEEVQSTPSMPQPPATQDVVETDPPEGSVARVVAIIVSAGLAWATAVTLVAWLLGRLLANG
jgi:hypothetical protein